MAAPPTIGRYEATPPDLNDGNYVAPLTDIKGRLITSSGGVAPLPPAPPSSWLTVADVVPLHGAFADPIVGAPTPLVLGVQLQADAGNSDYVLVTSSASIIIGGIRLDAGQSFFVPINDAAKVFVWSPSAAQAIEVALF